MVLRAAAKLTLELRVTGVRDDGYHLIDAEMVSLDFGDTLRIRPAPGPEVRVTVVEGASGRPADEDDLVVRALRAVGRGGGGAARRSDPVPGSGAGARCSRRAQVGR
ncbi:MAG: hypothetical protein R2716_03575 [Microthrixaceae bacterium]